MAIPCIPSLSSMGWIVDPAKKLDFAIADFLSSNYSQSEVFYGKIASLPYVIKECAGDLMLLRRQASETLNRHLSGLFESVSVSCDTREFSIDGSTRTMLIFRVSAIDQGQGVSFERVIEDINSPSLKLIVMDNN